jgi:hypothetical protein
MRVLGWSSVTIWLWVVDGFFYSLVSFIVVVVLVYKGSCMWDLIWILCFVKRRIRWDCCAFVIMCRGRWGKCGWFKVKKFCVFWVVFVGEFFFFWGFVWFLLDLYLIGIFWKICGCQKKMQQDHRKKVDFFVVVYVVVNHVCSFVIVIQEFIFFSCFKCCMNHGYCTSLSQGKFSSVMIICLC